MNSDHPAPEADIPVTFLKVEFIGSYWKIAWVMNLSKLLRLDAFYYSGGSRTRKLQRSIR